MHDVSFIIKHIRFSTFLHFGITEHMSYFSYLLLVLLDIGKHEAGKSSNTIRTEYFFQPLQPAIPIQVQQERTRAHRVPSMSHLQLLLKQVINLY